MKALIIDCSTCGAVNKWTSPACSSSWTTNSLIKTSIVYQVSYHWQPYVACGYHGSFSHRRHISQGACYRAKAYSYSWCWISLLSPSRIVTLLHQEQTERIHPHIITFCAMENATDADRKTSAGRTFIMLVSYKHFSQFDRLQQITHLLIISPSERKLVFSTVLYAYG